jgi:hypothetical protein
MFLLSLYLSRVLSGGLEEEEEEEEEEGLIQWLAWLRLALT